MFIKKKRSLITILVAIFATVFLCVGIALLTPETQTAQALTEPTSEFPRLWEDRFSGYADLTEIDFVKTAPEGYSDSGKALNIDIKIFTKDGDETKIAFVYDGIITAPARSSSLFSSLKKLTAIRFDNFTTSAVTDMSNMFYGCTSLTSITFGNNFTTSTVTDMTSMFASCGKLLSLDLSGFDISNVTSMRQMFLWCESLTTLDLSNFDTSVNPTGDVDLAGMFLFCKKLDTLILSEKFVSSKVSNIGSLFSGCELLTSNDLSKIDLSKFDLTNVTNINSLFDSCTKLAYVNFPAGFNTTNVNNMNKLFNGCTALTSVDLSDLNTANVENMSNMFSGCSTLSSITFGDNFNTPKVNSFRSMFSGCSALTELDLSNFTAENTDLDLGYMFSNCTNLAKLSVSGSLAQKIAAEENGYNKSQLYNICAKWYDSDGAEYSTTNAFTAAGTYFTTMPKYVVTCNNGSEVYETLEDAWTAANDATDATIKMNLGAEVKGALVVEDGNNIVLDLKGNKITYTGDGGSVIIVGGTFKLEDNGTGTHAITSPVTNEEVTIIGGLITGGKGSLGGAVFVSDGGTFTMESGTLAGNTAINGGGAVCCAGTFNFNGGKISHNKSGFGGGVCVYGDNANFVMWNGEISHNEATENGGGVYNTGIFNVNGAPKIADNTVSGDANNVFNEDNCIITVTGGLTDGAKIGISGAGEVAAGFTQTTGKPSGFFVPDNPEIVCIYVSDKAAGTVTFGSVHNGGTATCTQKAVCEMCGEEYGETDGNAHTFDKLVIVSATAAYSAFDFFDTQTAEVYAHCSACNQNVEKIAAFDLTVTYENGNCLHTDDTHVSLSAIVGGQTLISEDFSVNVSKCEATIVWEYTTSTVSEENAWVWNEITEGSHFTYDGASKSYRVRARFTGADNDPDKDKYYYRAVDGILLVDGGVKAIENAATYALSLDGSKFADYQFTNNSASIEVKPYEITLSDAEVYHWTLGAEKGSLLRDAYVEESNGTVLYYDPETGAADGRTYVTRSVVRYRGDDVALNIMLNGGEIADLFAGTGKRTDIAYSGSTAVGAVGKYTAIATLTLNDTLNYKYVGEITVADSRGMTIVISENGTKAVITKEWYVATINNGLLNVAGGGEYSVNGWTFGDDATTAVPMLEHGDENFDLNNILQDDRRISFGLFTDVDRTNQIGETFYRYNFADYINKSMPSGNYVLRVSVTEVKDADGLAYQAFTRTFTFTVQKGTLEVTDTLNGETFNHVYNGNVQLFDSEYNPTVSLKYVSASDRIGIWKNSGYDKLYGAAYMTFHLARWQTEGGVGYEFVSLTQLENTLDRKQAPREVDTYTVQYKISALNYADYGGSTSFTVTIAKQTVAFPQNVTETLIKEYVYQVPQNALYHIEGNAKFTQAGTHTITLKLADADNYEWVAGENVDGDTATVTVTLTMHDHVYGEWNVDIEPTCTEAGSRSKKCTLCDYIAEEEIAALGHNIAQHEAKAATCTEKGWNAYETCSRCDHNTYEEIAASGHNLTHVEYKEATADAAGNIEYWVCADCAEYFSDGGGETVISDKSSVEIPMLIKENNVGNGLSAGAVAGIIIACVIVALVAAYAAGYFFLYRKNILLKGKVFDAIYAPMNAIFNN